jgi:hypothetical protein
MLFSSEETVGRFGRLIRRTLTLKSAAADRRLHHGGTAVSRQLGIGTVTRWIVEGIWLEILSIDL